MYRQIIAVAVVVLLLGSTPVAAMQLTEGPPCHCSGPLCLPDLTPPADVDPPQQADEACRPHGPPPGPIVPQ